MIVNKIIMLQDETFFITKQVTKVPSNCISNNLVSYHEKLRILLLVNFTAENVPFGKSLLDCACTIEKKTVC